MIEIIGSEGTGEYRAAVAIRNALEQTWPGISTSPAEQDSIKIAVSVKIAGYAVQDIDIVLVGKFSPARQVRPTRVIRGNSGERLNSRPLLVESFVVAVEVKEQDERNVRQNEDQVQVRYSRSGKLEWKSATDQNNSQLHALKAYFADQHVDVFVRRCMIFPSLANVSAPSGLAAGFNAHQLFSAIASTSRVQERSGQGILSAGPQSNIERAQTCSLFREIIPTRLDRARMDRLIAKSPRVDDLIEKLGARLVCLRGHGGTGKTVLLLQVAWKQYRLYAKRTLLLTYNVALAADLRRLMALMAIPASLEQGGIEIATVTSFLCRWFSRLNLLQEDEMDYARYPILCDAALQKLKDGEVAHDDLVRIRLAEPERFEFDFVFVDEGQDWPHSEVALVKEFYAKVPLCVADGIDQLTRGGRADWLNGISQAEFHIEFLSKCLRLKRNLSLFVGEIADATGLPWEAQPNPLAGGGRIIILCRPYERSIDLHAKLMQDLDADGNSGVDMLFCVSPGSVTREGGVSHSQMSKTLLGWGCDIWDGVDPLLRQDFPRSSSQARIVQYASCRGLEGWTVVLDGFDEFLEGVAHRKMREGLTQQEAERYLDLKSEASREAWRLGMIALTRPIDTLVIQLHDHQKGFGRQIMDIATRLSDFCEIHV